MEDKKAEKLFYSGTANFVGSYMFKVYRSDDLVDNKSRAALVVDENNIDNVEKFILDKFDLILVTQGISDEKIKEIVIANIKVFRSNEDISFLSEGDIFEVAGNNQSSRFFILYRKDSSSNFIITTNHCNNKCIMCPQPINISEDNDVDLLRIENILKLMDKQTRFLTITGGEPTLLKQGLLDILRMCKKYLPNTKIAILSNGRMFSYISLVDAINSVGVKFLEIGIPIHSYSADGHDYITQVSDSFNQTIKGIKNLIASRNNVEIRVVIQKHNYLELDKVANFIVQEMIGISRVSFIGMEMLGSAVINAKSVWVPYKDINESLTKAILKLLTHGIHADIYNIPPCKISSEFRSLCAKSISDYKVRYLEECNSCAMKNDCGGIFASSLNLIKEEGVSPIG
jgi:His-Xaa-Ser system radical SAM maturase HxsC